MSRSCPRASSTTLPASTRATGSPARLAAEGILWVLRQPPEYTGRNEGMAALREEHGIMREHEPTRRIVVASGRPGEPDAPAPGVTTPAPPEPKRARATWNAPASTVWRPPSRRARCPGCRRARTSPRRSWARCGGRRASRSTGSAGSPASGRATAWWQAFYREEPTGPTITLPRRYRTKGVVLHELVHWALAGAPDLADHGSTFARVLVERDPRVVLQPRAGRRARSRLPAGAGAHRRARWPGRPPRVRRRRAAPPRQARRTRASTP